MNMLNNKNTKGQELKGVTLPAANKVKGWEFGDNKKMACFNVDDNYYAVDGICSRCGFDLWKGKVLSDVDVWGPDPVVACPTCSTTYNIKSGVPGPPMKKEGWFGFVNDLAQTATTKEAGKPVTAYAITVDEDDKIYIREI